MDGFFRRQLGTEITPRGDEKGGFTQSARYAAIWAVWPSIQDEQTPRLLHENAECPLRLDCQSEDVFILFPSFDLCSESTGRRIVIPPRDR